MSAKNLRNDYIHATPVDYSWDGEWLDVDGTGKGWTSWDAATCEKCGAVLVLTGEQNEHHKYLHTPEDCSVCDGVGETGDGECSTCKGTGEAPGGDCEGYVSASAPMMSYYYPLDWGDTEDARKLARLPVCLVEVDGTKGIALTGGGMDLSWEICAAYVALGYLPPLHFCADLPRMAGLKGTERTRTVLEAAARTAEIAELWARNARERIESLRADLIEQPAAKE